MMTPGAVGVAALWLVLMVLIFVGPAVQRIYHQRQIARRTRERLDAIMSRERI